MQGTRLSRKGGGTRLTVVTDRVLVRVGYNREDNLMDYDEAMQVRCLDVGVVGCSPW